MVFTGRSLSVTRGQAPLKSVAAKVAFEPGPRSPANTTTLWMELTVVSGVATGDPHNNWPASGLPRKANTEGAVINALRHRTIRITNGYSKASTMRFLVILVYLVAARPVSNLIEQILASARQKMRSCSPVHAVTATTLFWYQKTSLPISYPGMAKTLRN